MPIAIRIENLGKKYDLSQLGYGSLRRDFGRWMASIRGKPDPHSPLGQHEEQEFWALRDISFDVGCGETVGIIGPNGSGKSTLLKILSRITLPTTGRASINGKVASLLEVGTGFHPDLSGRENVMLNGAILGIRQREIAAKMKEIHDFSGIGDFLDIPVKRYASGMYVRLAFSVAVHFTSEIIILDEIMAVGDASFQKRSRTKIRELIRDGRTILFVSHDKLLIKKICNRAILLTKGRMVADGKPDRLISLMDEKLPSAYRQKTKP